MNDNSNGYASDPNGRFLPLEDFRDGDKAALQSGEFHPEQLEQLDEVPISIPGTLPETAELTSQITTPIIQTKKQKFLKMIGFALLFLKRKLIQLLKINLKSYLIMNLCFFVLFKYKVISALAYVILWSLSSFWLICFKVREFLQTNNLLYDLFRIRGNIPDVERNQANPEANNPSVPWERRNVAANNSNNDVLRRREMDNLVAFHPLRFHMIVGRLHNILNQLRENQMIINAAVMGNNRDGRLNFRDFHDLFMNGGLNRNAPQQNGFTEAEIENLPSFQYEKAKIEEGETKKPEEEEQCSICLMEFQSGEVIRTLPCIHNFHKDCIDQWLKRQKYCPLCKGEVLFN